MNFNEFSFERLFESAEFERYESPELRTALTCMHDFIEEKLESHEDRQEFENFFGDCFLKAIDSGFEHGFKFAANMVKTILKA